MRVVFVLLLLPMMVFAENRPTPDEDRIVSSWQVLHPVATGVMSAFTMGLWPMRFLVVRFLFIVRPHTNHLYDVPLLIDLINQPMLNTDSSRICTS